MTAGSCPVIPYEKQEDPRTNRMCGAACLAMVYRSLAGLAEKDGARKRRKERRSESRAVPGGAERRAGRRRASELTQAEIWSRISKPNRSGTLSAATHLMVADARSRGLAAVAVQARHPLAALLSCRENGVLAILNHRLRADSGAGHFSVLLDVDAENVVLHDPYFGPRRRLPHAELLELWQPRYEGSEIVGNVLIGFAASPSALSACPLCATPLPRQVPCPRCHGSVNLQPPDLLGCVGAPTCLGRLWDYVCCPSCDNMWSFVATAAPKKEADAGWNLGPFFAELDRFREKVLEVPGVSRREDVRKQLEFIEESKLRLRLAEAEEQNLRKVREERLDAMKRSHGEQVAAVAKAREEAAKPAAPTDGAALGDALLKELGITR